MKAGALFAMAVFALGGCASVDYATFATKTSISVVDGDTTPAGASIGFDRVEAYVGPRLPDGKVYPTVASVQSDGSGMSRTIQQTFAGGKAALVVLNSGASLTTSACEDKRQPPLMFGTSTNIGLKLGFAEGSVVPNSFNLGYRRKELAAVPVTQNCQPSVLAYAQNAPDVAGAPQDGKGRPQLALGLTQFFATGEAADKLAENELVRAGFAARAEVALAGVEAFNKREQVQGRLTVDIFECLESLDPARMKQVIAHGVSMQVFANDGAANKAAGAAIGGDAQTSDASRRKNYVEAMSLQMGQSGPAGSRDVNLRAHREVVCALAGRS